MSQLTLFDGAAGKALKEKALKKVALGSPPGWIEKAIRAVSQVARDTGNFTSDDVWAVGLERPPEPRALGAVMSMMAKLGLIEKTGAYTPTTQKSRHAAPIAVWRARRMA